MRPLVGGAIPGRHTPFFRVMEALGDAGCPVCRLSVAAASRQLEALAYEGANEIETRAILRASRAFCAFHARQLAAAPSSGLGIAVIYADVLSDVATVLERGARGRAGEGIGSVLARRILPQQPCPVCETLADAERRYLSVLTEHLSDADFASAFVNSSGLCLPHLGRALSRVTSADDVDILLSPGTRLLEEAPVTEPCLSGRTDSASGRTDPAEWIAGARGARLVGGHLSETPEGERSADEESAGTEHWREGDSASALDGSMEDGADRVLCHGCRAALASEVALLARAVAEESDGLPDLCEHHIWRLRDLGGEAATLLLRRLLEERVRALASTPLPPRQPKAGLLDRLGLSRRRSSEEDGIGRSSCGFHAARWRAEREWARSFAAAEDDAVGEAIAAPSYLCLPHLSLALAASAPPRARTIALLAAGRIGLLVGDLNEFVRKQDYRFRHEPKGSEATSPGRAVELAVGAEGLLGPGEMWWPMERRK